MAKLVKPNYTRGQIFDRLAACFGTSVLGMYEGKLRIELMDDAGEVLQFSLAPVIHKTNVEEVECDKLVSIEDQMGAYEAAQTVKSSENEAKKAKTAAAKSKAPKVAKDKTAISDAVAKLADAGPVTPIEVTPEEQAKLDELAKFLGDGAAF